MRLLSSKKILAWMCFVHGEFERNDMVEYFGQNLNGFLFTKNAWVQSYGTRCVKPPIGVGDVSRANPITVEVERLCTKPHRPRDEGACLPAL